MTVVMWIVLWLLWTALMLIAGYYSGYENHKKEARFEQKVVEYNSTQITPTADQIEHVKRAFDEYLSEKMVGPPGPPGKTPDADALIVDKSLDLTLSEWRASVESRLKRVEKKSGMSV